MAIKFNFTGRKNETEGYNDFNEDIYGANPFELEDEGDLDLVGSMHDETPAPAASSVALKIVNPKSHEEAKTIADLLLNGNTVLLNIEELDRDSIIRLLDFLSGAIHMIGGNKTRVGKTMLVFAPKNVDVSSIEAMVGTSAN